MYDLLHSNLGAQGDRLSWVMTPTALTLYIHLKEVFSMHSKYLLLTYTENSVSNTQMNIYSE